MFCAEVHRLVALCSGEVFLEPFAVVLNGALVVLVEVLPGPACVAPAVLLAAVFSLMVCVFGHLGVHSGEGSSQDRPLSLLVELGYVLMRFSQDGS
ncbi:hypothetical protein Taro_047456 [Colocasia esculenta]|uniref:Uncharacterized protein n=1 Tax=Colocasia esculenta TaxID=4460 RepID=A0A843WSZ5_COLES|nr:hypothetical protein [Colocasia esculenta]